MSREHVHISVQADQLFEYALHEQVIIASRMVCAAYRSSKQGIAADEHLLRALKEADSSRCVSRRIQYFKLQTSHMNLILATHRSLFPGFLYRIPIESGRFRQPERLAEIGIGHFQCVNLARVHIYRYVICLSQCGHSIYMVEMCVREHYAHRLQSLCSDE